MSGLDCELCCVLAFLAPWAKDDRDDNSGHAIQGKSIGALKKCDGQRAMGVEQQSAVFKTGRNFRFLA